MDTTQQSMREKFQGVDSLPCCLQKDCQRRCYLPGDLESFIAREKEMSYREGQENKIKEVREGVEKVKEEVAEVNGTHKYDSCYDDVLSLPSLNPKK